MEKPIKITVVVPWYKRLKWDMVEFFRILSGGQYCCNCKMCFDYECEYCYIRKPHWYSKQIRTKFQPLEWNSKLWSRITKAFESLKPVKLGGTKCVKR